MKKRRPVDALRGTRRSYVSVFAGRFADTGRDPLPFIQHAVAACNAAGGLEVIWANCRELLNIMQANAIGCHVITVPFDIIKKLGNVGRDLRDYSLETVKISTRTGLRPDTSSDAPRGASGAHR